MVIPRLHGVTDKRYLALPPPRSSSEERMPFIFARRGEARDSPRHTASSPRGPDEDESATHKHKKMHAPHARTSPREPAHVGF